MRGSLYFTSHNEVVNAPVVDLTGVRIMGAPIGVRRVVQTPRAVRDRTVQLDPILA